MSWDGTGVAGGASWPDSSGRQAVVMWSALGLERSLWQSARWLGRQRQPIQGTDSMFVD